jgi:hypothetical protein
VEHYTRALTICERLANSDPHNTEWQHDLAISLIILGRVRAHEGDTTHAVEHCTRAMHIFEVLADSDPHNTGWQTSRWVGHYEVASVLESAGDPSALDHWANAHRILTALDAAGALRDSDRQFFEYVTGKLGPT